MNMNMNMNSEIMKGMSQMIGEIVSKAVRHCGSVHNFDAEEMIRAMNIMDMSLSLSESKSKSKVLKACKPKILKSKFPLPFCGELKEGWCHALRQNHGLYTQCETDVKGETYCKKCGPSPEYGTIEDRLKVGLMEFRDPKGKAPTHFTKVMKKLKISREEVEEEAGKLNIIINDIHFEEEKVDKKEKGRPKKPKRKIELADDSTDLFAVLVAKANEVDFSSDDEESKIDEKASIAESIIETVLDKVNETVENNEKKALKLAEKEAEKQKKDAEKQAEKQKKEAEKAEKEAEKQKKEAEKAEKEAEKQALLQKKEAEKQALIQKKEEEKQALIQKKEEEKQALIQKKEEEKQALLQKKEAEKQALLQKKEAEKANKPVAKAPKSKKETSDSETDKKKSKPAEKKVTKEVEEEEEDVVKRFEFEGIKYLKSKKTGIIYNMDQDVIGKWNEKTNKIDFEEAGSEEEEDEYDE